MNNAQVFDKLVRVVRALGLRLRRPIARTICIEFSWDLEQFMEAVHTKGFTTAIRKAYREDSKTQRVARYVEIAKEQILEDCRDGRVIGEDVTKFADLHDYTDANMYGGAADLMAAVGSAKAIDILNAGQAKLDKWIKAGALAFTVDGKVTRVLGKDV